MRVQINEYKFTSYEFNFTSYQFKSTGSGIISSMKTQVNSLKISSFSKILSFKSFGNSWGKSSVQYLVIISCFIFPLFYDYAFSRKQCEQILTLKEDAYIRISYSLKYKHSKVKFLCKKIYGSVDWNKHSGEQH